MAKRHAPGFAFAGSQGNFELNKDDRAEEFDRAVNPAAMVGPF